jgi:dolichyl-phosphate-mannose--protein O-mannosyl transferase
LPAIRFLPALATSLTVVLSAMIARELGGGAMHCCSPPSP